MAIKKIKTYIKLNLEAGKATAGPPLGPALGQHGLPIMDFVKAYNEKTSHLIGNTIPVVITVYEDRTFSFVTKLPPVTALIKKTLNLQKGSQKPGKDKTGSLTKDQIQSIASEKLADLNTNNLESAMKVVAGTARSMGVAIN